jgi:hypothetical protein
MTSNGLRLAEDVDLCQQLARALAGTGETPVPPKAIVSGDMNP